MAWISGAIAAGGSLLGGMMGSNSAKDAAKEQAKAAREATKLQKYMYETTRQDQAPFMEAGYSGTNRLLTLLGLGGNQTAADYGKYAKDFSMSDFQQDPGYAFRLNEGLKALDRQAAARGGLISGSALKASQRYGQDMASQEYQNAFNRYQVNRSNQLTPLQSLMGAGQTTANTLANTNQGYANAAGQTAMDYGNARASGYMGQANALSNALAGAGNTAMQFYTLNKLMGNQNPYLSPGSSGGGGYYTPGGMYVDTGTA